MAGRRALRRLPSKQKVRSLGQEAKAARGEWRNGLAEGFGKFIHADGQPASHRSLELCRLIGLPPKLPLPFLLVRVCVCSHDVRSLQAPFHLVARNQPRT